MSCLYYKIKGKKKYLFEMYTVSVIQQNKVQVKKITANYFKYQILLAYK